MAISYKVIDKSTRVNNTGSFGRLLDNMFLPYFPSRISVLLITRLLKDEIILDEAAWDTYKSALLLECDSQDVGPIGELLEATRIANIEGFDEHPWRSCE